MLLAIDIGNTHTTLGLIDGDDVPRHWRLSTRAARTDDELAVILRGFFEMDAVDLSDIDGVVIGSVVRHLTSVYRSACERVLDVEALVVRGVTPMPVSNGYKDPEAVGIDRLANAVAGISRFGKPLIVVDFGTATTLDVVTSEAVYAGGVILPGPDLTADALSAGASLLPRVPIEPPDCVIGRTTRDSIQSGIFHGAAGAVDALVEKIRVELGAPCKVVATGGLASLFAEHCHTISDREPFLTLLGLAEIWGYQRR